MKEILDLPSEWWMQPQTVYTLIEWFKRHVLALFVSAKEEGERRYFLFSGFIIKREENLVWVTAGHVIDRLNKIRTDPNFEILQMQWIDEHDGSSDVPFHVHHPNFKTYSAMEDDIDIGIGLLEGLDALNLEQNENLGIITEQAWKNLVEASPEGYYLIGYPSEWIEESKQRVSRSQIVRSFIMNMACIPISPLNWEDLPYQGGSWKDPDAFYGHIEPFPSEQGEQPLDISGMSGGPLLSIERTPSGQLAYRLVGVQSSWLENRRLIRAEPILTFAKMVDSWITVLTT